MTMEDAYLDTWMEDHISGPEGQDPFDVDPHWEYEDEEYDPEPMEDFGWFGEAGLWD